MIPSNTKDANYFQKKAALFFNFALSSPVKLSFTY